MRKIACCFLLLCTSILMHGQTTIIATGILTDSVSQSAVSYATVRLFKDDSIGLLKPFASVFSDENGSFSLKIVPDSNYILKIQALGYALVTKSVRTNDGQNDWGKIAMQPINATLNTVNIVAKKPLIEMKADRIIYNVENDPDIVGASSIDILQKMPLIYVDMNDNIKLKGKSNFQVHLNGRNTGLFARNPKEALKSFPAHLIVRIEIITTPGARYDAEGVGGIINIVTRKKIVGTRGSMEASISTLGEHNESFNINSKQGKVGLSMLLSSSGNNNPQYSEYERINYIPTSIQKEERIGEGRTASNIYKGFAEIGWDIDSLNTISLHFDLDRQIYDYYMDVEHLGYGELSQITERGAFYNSTKSWTFVQNTGLDYIRKFKNEGQQLNISLISNTQNGQDSVYALRAFTGSSTNSKRWMPSSLPVREHTIDTDYSQNLNDQNSCSFGIKAIIRDFANTYSNDSIPFGSEIAVRDDAQSGVFKYKQNVFSSYYQHAYNLEKWGFMAGIRYEFTQSNGTLNNAQPFMNDYHSFFPSFSVSYSPDPTSGFQLGGSKRIQRPDLWYLNPQIDLSDPRKISSGNSLLDPEFVYDLNLGWNKMAGRRNYNINVSQSWTAQAINSITVIDPISGVSTTSFKNTGKSTRTGLDVSFTGAVSKKVFAYVKIAVGYERWTGSDETGMIVNTGFSGQSVASFNYRFNKGWRAEVLGVYDIGSVQLQGRSTGFYTYHFGVGKSLLKNKSLRLTLRSEMPFQKNWNYISTIQSPEFSISDTHIRPARKIQLSCFWRFGKLKEDVSRKRDVSNGDLKQGGKK